MAGMDAGLSDGEREFVRQEAEIKRIREDAVKDAIIRRLKRELREAKKK